MQRAESEQEQLWSYIQARKQKETQPSNGHRNGASNGTGQSTDVLLVNLLYTALEENQSSTPIDSSSARSLLKTAISADTAARLAPRPRAPKFWQVSNRRQLAAVVALCLLTAAALGYLLWYFGPIQSMCNGVTTPPQSPVVAPTKPGTAEKKPPKSGAQSTLPVVGAAAKMSIPKDCDAPQVK